MEFKRKQKPKSKELGFGQKAYSKGTRLITQNGGFNVVKHGMGFWTRLDIYHELVTMKWFTFFGIITGSFFIINLCFALLYYFSGPDDIVGRVSESNLDHFLSSFYFSTQTITTVGFGHLSPNSNFVSVVAAIESFMGLLAFALATGLMFARFSRPRRNLVYSENAIIAPYHDMNALMFRFANKSRTQLVEAEIDVVISYWNNEEERRIFERVDLERNKINFFSASWTIVHPINENSPIKDWDEKAFADHDLEVIVMFKAFDDSYARQVYDRMSYVAGEILWGRKFIPIFDKKDGERIWINMEKLGESEAVSLN